MTYLSHNDTIAAIATPPGLGGIAVLRISGPSARDILSALFIAAKADRGDPRQSLVDNSDKLFAAKPRYMHYGYAVDCEGAVIDEVLAVYMPGPNSFTGEDIGEIHCHGGLGVSAAVLESAVAASARIAAPGEFTRRAFMNGRMDLTQAEAVAELISAPGREGARLAAAKLEGALGRQVRSIRDSLDAMRMQVILAVDFPDEEAELLSRDAFLDALASAAGSVQRLLASFERARFWREGALAVLAGRVNAGKSSLLNALLGKERAIVSSSPGTTRDYIEENVNLKGMPLRLVDTAGLRLGGDLVEEEGIRRSRKLAEDADIIIFVTDATLPLHDEERDFLQRHAQRIRNGSLIAVLNKIDAVPQAGHNKAGSADTLVQELLHAKGLPATLDPSVCHAVSAREGLGLDNLSQGILAALSGNSPQREGATSAVAGETDVAPNLRQSELLRAVLPELESLRMALEQCHPPDILGVHLDAAMDYLDEVCGSTDNEALLDRIFGEFCIGK